MLLVCCSACCFLLCTSPYWMFYIYPIYSVYLSVRFTFSLLYNWRRCPQQCVDGSETFRRTTAVYVPLVYRRFFPVLLENILSLYDALLNRYLLTFGVRVYINCTVFQYRYVGPMYAFSPVKPGCLGVNVRLLIID